MNGTEKALYKYQSSNVDLCWLWTAILPRKGSQGFLRLSSVCSRCQTLRINICSGRTSQSVIFSVRLPPTPSHRWTGSPDEVLHLHSPTEPSGWCTATRTYSIKGVTWELSILQWSWSSSSYRALRKYSTPHPTSSFGGVPVFSLKLIWMGSLYPTCFPLWH